MFVLLINLQDKYLYNLTIKLYNSTKEYFRKKDNMNRNFKIAMYFIMTIIVIGVVAAVFFAILPYVIIAALVFWGIFKVREYFYNKKYKNEYNEGGQSYTETYTYTNSDSDTKTTKYEEDNDFDTSKAIDVDFEEVKKDKK